MSWLNNKNSTKPKHQKKRWQESWEEEVGFHCPREEWFEHNKWRLNHINYVPKSWYFQRGQSPPPHPSGVNHTGGLQSPTKAVNPLCRPLMCLHPLLLSPLSARAFPLSVFGAAKLWPSFIPQLPSAFKPEVGEVNCDPFPKGTLASK